ncbi:response regulator transcription factor [Mucilaginibacter robiniae]|uniref:Response regulator transcription factor n=1 Tax=Mucilaginibacter robiniae TaxID=2728022 RepID=A0A7L5E6I6_9SPHI|nr:response regulator transcription factor [Mucilaginibacter robiniae]QJD96443.1 response regulator transcription factor [Mucilaginibacter robiniae]
MNRIKVLLAEDEPALAHIIRESLEERNFEVMLCNNGEQALQCYRKYQPDVIALDVMMPKLDGFEVARQIRVQDLKTPIIFLTARSQSKDVVTGFELGANDYLKKPFGVEELIVRIKVLLSSYRMLDIKSHPASSIYYIGSMVFNADKGILQNEIETISLTTRESDILRVFCKNSHQVVERKILLNNLWGDDNFFNARSLDVFITKLRRHLEADAQVQIVTIRGVGYKLVW